MDSKKPWQSKMLVLNGVAGLGAFALLFWAPAAQLQPWLDGHVAQIGVVWSLLNVALRLVTKDRISLGD